MSATPKQRAVIDKAFRDMPDMFRGFGNDKDRLYAKCLESEKQHRYNRPAVRGFSANSAARYFAVKWLREYVLRKDRVPTVAEYLSIREDAFFAAALAEANRDSLRAWASSVSDEFDALDYAAMME